MAVRLPNSVYVHMMKTGGWSVREALSQMKLVVGEIGRDHDPACLLPLQSGPRPFIFVFIRHPLSWYRSYWAFRMQENWKVRPDQPITGWQTFGSVLDHECRSDKFETWMRNVLAYVPEGFLSRIYRIYTEGVDFVGKVEFFPDDLCQALTFAGEAYSPAVVASMPRKNVTDPRFLALATLSSELAHQVMRTEEYVVERWGYRTIPEHMIKGRCRSLHHETEYERHQ